MPHAFFMMDRIVRKFEIRPYEDGIWVDLKDENDNICGSLSLRKAILIDQEKELSKGIAYIQQIWQDNALETAGAK